MLVSAQGCSQEEKLFGSGYGRAGRREWSHSKLLSPRKGTEAYRRVAKTGPKNARTREDTQRAL